MEHTFTVPADHPALPGHFPGNPIVPGVVLLDEVASALRRLWPGAVIKGLPNAKFLSPLLPGEACTVRFGTGRGGSVKFECRSGERLVASGSFALAACP
jgi:3-hydroxyacyl-[acyl-carrier-protein] dehydratase